MGTVTVGNTSLDTSHGATWGFAGQNIMDGGTNTMPEDGYIDSMTVYMGATSGVVSTYHVMWNTSLNVIAQIGPGNFGALGWKTNNLAAGSYHFMAGGTVIHQGVATAGSTDFKFRSTGNNFAKTTSATPISMSGATQNQFTTGYMECYFTYFPVATLTSFSPTVGGTGTTVTLTGKSYSAGVTGVSFNGTAASSYSYINDTTVTAVVPSGATSGTITITTNAGNATSASSFTVAGARVMRSGVWTPTQGVFVMRSGTWTQVNGVFVMRSGTWTSTG